MKREEKLGALRAWLIENIPRSAEPDIRYVNRKDKAVRLREKLDKFKDIARVNLKWRETLSDRLQITAGDIVAATNTIVEMMEQELAGGGTIRLANFGDLKTVKIRGGRGVRFTNAEEWVRLLNEPIYKSEIGMKRKISKNKLIRR